MDDEPSPDRSPVAIVGAGAVGTALARRLVECGYPVRAVLSRDEGDARALAARVGAARAASGATALPAEVRLVLLCVPDDAIPSVAEALAAVDHPWRHTVVGHTSGARTAGTLEALAERGAATLSFHPLQTFAPDTDPAAFEDIAVAVEGDDAAVMAGKGLARTLGARPLVLSADEKVRYHCAAALASNGLVALVAAVEEVLAGTGLDEASAVDLFGPLVEQTWGNLREAPPESVLTGPVARGDRETVESHLRALEEETPHLVPLYAALSTEMARTAVRGGQLGAETAEQMLRLLREALSGPSDDNPPDVSH